MGGARKKTEKAQSEIVGIRHGHLPTISVWFSLRTQTKVRARNCTMNSKNARDHLHVRCLKLQTKKLHDDRGKCNPGIEEDPGMDSNLKQKAIKTCE